MTDTSLRSAPTHDLQGRLTERGFTSQPATPWQLQDYVRLTQAQFIGAVAMLVGWFALAETTVLSRQALYLVVTIAGLLVASAGWAFWLLAGLRAIRTRRGHVHQAVSLIVDEAAAMAPPPEASDEALVAGANMTKYHLPGCLLVEGKAVEAADATHNRSACPVCLP